MELDFLKQHGSSLPASFITYWTSYYRYYNYFFMQQYPQVHELLMKRRYTDTIPEANYAVVKEMPYDFNDSMLQVTPYLLYLTGVFEAKLRAAGYNTVDGTVTKQRFDDSVYKLGYKLLPPASGEYFIAQNIYGRAKVQDPSIIQPQLAQFKKHWPHSAYLPVLEQQAAIGQRLAKGQPAPDFEMQTLDGKTMKLSDLKDKVVYLHFWAAWCKQCIGEMMNEQKVKALTKGKPVEFLYVSIDGDTAADRSVINRLKLKGTFANVSGGWSAKAAQLYGVQALPAYFLIDSDGLFATQAARTPAQHTELAADIKALCR